MADITLTETRSGRVYSSSSAFDDVAGYKLSNGDTYIKLSAATSEASAETVKDGKKVLFGMTGFMPQDRGAHVISDLDVVGAPGKQNVLVLPGRQDDYEVRVAEFPLGLGGRQQMGDITLVDKTRSTPDGKPQHIHLHNITSVGFLDGRDLAIMPTHYSGDVPTVPTKPLFDAAYAKLAPIEQCKHQAVSTKEAGDFMRSQNPRTMAEFENAQAVSLDEATKKHCPSR